MFGLGVVGVAAAYAAVGRMAGGHFVLCGAGLAVSPCRIRINALGILSVASCSHTMSAVIRWTTLPKRGG